MAVRTYFGPIRSNISEEGPVDFYFFGPMAWFYPNNFKTQNLAQFGLVGPNIGPNWGLYNKKCKFWLKIYQWLSKNFVLSEYGVCSSKIKDFAFRTYFGPIRSNISEECPVDIHFFGPMAWFYPNMFKIGLGLPGRVFLIFDLGHIPPQGAV